MYSVCFLPIDEQCERKNKQLKPEERENTEEKERENNQKQIESLFGLYKPKSTSKSSLLSKNCAQVNMPSGRTQYLLTDNRRLSISRSSAAISATSLHCQHH